MSTLIRNGTIVTAQDEYIADIFVVGEKITAIGKNLPMTADQEIDAAGKFILPGGVDQHTHFDALCNVGNRNTTGYEASVAGLVGGTTTIVDFAPQDPGCSMIDSIRYRKEYRAKPSVSVDYALHALVTEASENILEEIPKLKDEGVSSIKLFTAYKGSPLYVDDAMLYRVFEESAKHGITPFVHAENAHLIATLQKQLLSEGKTKPGYHAEAHPPFTESEAVERVIKIADAANAPVCIVHITCEEAVDVVKRAKAQNKPVFGETCTHYLIFTQDKLFQEEDLESAKYICTPPLRQERDQKVLWDSLNNGWLQVIASDHCGIGLADMKAKALDDFTMIPNGSPGIGDRIPILWTYGVSAGKMTRTKLVDVCSTTPAKLNGIYPRKGHVGIGSDADLVILDPTYEGVVANEDNPNGEDYNIYEGMKLSGRIEKVFLRGKLVVDNHKFIGTLGQGKFIPSDLFGLAYRTNTHN